MKNTIPNTFENFNQRKLTNGIETSSDTIYKGYHIFLRAYTGSGISYRVYKYKDNKKVKFRRRAYYFKLPIDLLQEAKDYIDNNEDKLIIKFNN